MARIANTKWNELKNKEDVLVQTIININIGAPKQSTKGSANTNALYDIKDLALDAMFEASMGWNCKFAKEVREAVNEHRFNDARKMIATKSGEAQKRIKILISIIELITNGGIN